MQDVISFTWPAAVATIAAVLAVVAGVLKMFSMGKATITTGSLQKDVRDVATRVLSVEHKVTALETIVDKTLTEQIKDLKLHVRDMSGKMDTLVKEVVSVLSAIGRS